MSPVRARLPAGTPPWVTAELVALTRRVWSPRYGRELSDAEAVELIVAAGRLLAVFTEPR